MVVMDSFALPVEGTETRVNAQAQGYEYMTEYIEAAKKVMTYEGGNLQYISVYSSLQFMWYTVETGYKVSEYKVKSDIK